MAAVAAAKARAFASVVGSVKTSTPASAVGSVKAPTTAPIVAAVKAPTPAPVSALYAGPPAAVLAAPAAVLAAPAPVVVAAKPPAPEEEEEMSLDPAIAEDVAIPGWAFMIPVSPVYDLVIDIDSISHGNAHCRHEVLSYQLRGRRKQQAVEPVADDSSATRECITWQDLPRGWPILLSKRVLNHVAKLVGDKFEEKEFMNAVVLGNGWQPIVSVAGLYNKGKTFILSKILGMKLPDGHCVHTRGLSFLFAGRESAMGKDLFFLDTAGTNSPMYCGSSNDINLAYKKTTESLLSDVSFELSDCVIFVVNELTWDDQQAIQFLADSLRKAHVTGHHQKQIIVIHNWVHVEKFKDVPEMWRKYVLRSHEGKYTDVKFDYKNSECTCPAFMQSIPDVKTPILHFMLAKEGSEAGKVLNDITFEAIRQRLRFDFSKGEEHLLARVQKVLNAQLERYCKNPKRVMLCQDQAPVPEPLEKNSITPGLARSIVSIDPACYAKLSNCLHEPATSACITANADPKYHDPFHVDDEAKFKETCALSYSGIYFTVEGDLTLRKENVILDGYHIYLKAEAETCFAPQIDSIDEKNGLFFLIDLPGFADEKNEFEVRPEADKITVSGTRQLFFSPRDDGDASGQSEDGLEIYRSANTAQDDAHTAPAPLTAAASLQVRGGESSLNSQGDNFSRKMYFCERQAGSFKRQILVDPTVYDAPSSVANWVSDGVLQIFVPRRALPKAITVGRAKGKCN